LYLCGLVEHSFRNNLAKILIVVLNLNFCNFIVTYDVFPGGVLVRHHQAKHFCVQVQVAATFDTHVGHPHLNLTNLVILFDLHFNVMRTLFPNVLNEGFCESESKRSVVHCQDAQIEVGVRENEHLNLFRGK
jgi:hypothetical protein